MRYLVEFLNQLMQNIAIMGKKSKFKPLKKTLRPRMEMIKITIINSKIYRGDAIIIEDLRSFLNTISVPFFKKVEKNCCFLRVLISLNPLKLSSIL